MVRLGVVFILLVGAVSSAPALELRAYDPARHDRFTGFPTAPAHNPGFLFADADLTGVGWVVESPQRQVTLVSPVHFVGANHYRPAADWTIRFLDASGQSHDFSIASMTSILNEHGEATDLFLGELATPVSPDVEITPVSYLNLPEEADYLGIDLAVLGRDARAGRSTLSHIMDFGSGNRKTRGFLFYYDPDTGDADDCYLAIGDSGSPALSLAGPRPALVGVHYATVAQGAINIDSLVPHYVDELNELMEGAGYHMIPIDPESALLTASGISSADPLRQGYAGSVVLEIGNAGDVAGNNVEVDIVCDAALAPDTITGTGWISEKVDETTWRCRRGGLAAGTSSSLTLAWTEVATVSAIPVELHCQANEFPQGSISGQIAVNPTFRVWAEGLADPTATGDDDGDGIRHLLEYAFDANPEEASHFLADQMTPLAPETELSPAGLTLSYLRRPDAAERGLHYIVEYSTDLQEEGWSATPPAEASEDVATVEGTVLERVRVTCPVPGQCLFMRVRVVLDE